MRRQEKSIFFIYFYLFFTERYEERPNTPNHSCTILPPFLSLLSRSSFMINVLRLNEWLMTGGWLLLLYQPMTVQHWSLSDKIHCSVFYHFNFPVDCKRILNICSCINSCWAFLNMSYLSVSVILSQTHTPSQMSGQTYSWLAFGLGE